jgi:hypothetical protein
MEFIETQVFTRQIVAYPDSEYRELQNLLEKRPAAGKIIHGSAGCRKVRWAVRGKGKSSGARVIYYWRGATSQIVFLYLYLKAEQRDLTNSQVKKLKAAIQGGDL